MYWYAVSTKPRQENIAQTNLNNLGIETFCPQLKQNKIIRRKRQTVVGPLFPGYFFVRFDVNTHYRAVNYARGMRGVVMFGSVPAKVDDEMIISIQSRLEDGCMVLEPPSFTAGETVVIESGPFGGLQGIFERYTTGEERVILLLKALSFQARAVVDLEHVAKC